MSKTKGQSPKKIQRPTPSKAKSQSSKQQSRIPSKPKSNASLKAQRPTPKATSSAPSEEVAAQLDSLDSELQSLADGISFSEHHRAISDLDTGIGDLLHQIENLRTRGYRYKSFLENKIKILDRKWRTSHPTLRREIEHAEAELQPLYDQVSRKFSRATTAAQVSALEREIGQLRTRLDAAEEAVEATYSGIRQTFYQTQSQVREVIWLLDQVDQASFDLLAGENPVQAAKAKWWRDGKKQGPEGVLYLTDQRLIFEQKEEVATKKVLFVATEKETIQQMLFEVPVAAIESVQASSRGVMGHQDHLDFEFGAGATYANAHFHIDGQDSEFWAGLVRRVRNGDIERERVVVEGEDVPAEAQASLADAPQQCDACGAPFDTVITKGQRQIQCEYCGTVMRW